MKDLLGGTEVHWIVSSFPPLLNSNFNKSEEVRAYSVSANINSNSRDIELRQKKTIRKSVQAFYPHTSRSALSKLDDSIRPQTSSKIFSRRGSRSGRNTPGLSPMIFNTFRKNLGFYQQMLTAKSNIAQGSLEIMCKKLITTKKLKYK